MALHLHGQDRLDGLEVMFLDDEGPAAFAGIQEGDRVVEVQGVQISDLSSDEVETLFHGIEPGDRVEVELVREGQSRELVLRALRMPLRAKAEALGAHFLRQRARARHRPGS